MTAVISVSVDTSQPGIVPRRTITLGETFVVTIWAHDDGEGKTPTVFDRIVLGVYFNDKKENVLAVTKAHFPNAGDLAANRGTVDAYSGRPVVPFMEMTLMPPGPKFVDPHLHEHRGGTPEGKAERQLLPEHFQDSAGIAGFANEKEPFTLFPGEPAKMVAAGKLNGGFRSTELGTSTILAAAPRGHAELSYEGELIFAKTIPAEVTVVEERTTPARQEIGVLA
jgi:hypothetical protein